MKKDQEYLSIIPDLQTHHDQTQLIFLLEELKEGITKLNRTIEDSDNQSRNLENSNYRLQLAMLVLTLIGTLAIIYPFAIQLINFLHPYIDQIIGGTTSAEFNNTATNIIALIIAIFAIMEFRRQYNAILSLQKDLKKIRERRDAKNNS